MGSLIRIVFWFSLVLLLLPFRPSGESDDGLDPVQAMHAAREALRDVTGMCERRPHVCATGKDAIETIGIRAREGARIAAGLLTEEDDDGGGRTVTTGSVGDTR